VTIRVGQPSLIRHGFFRTDDLQLEHVTAILADANLTMVHPASVPWLSNGALAFAHRM
jgi:hypothetical protein